MCDVTSSNETSISCSVGESVVGVFDVLVEVEGKGFAEYPNGESFLKFSSLTLSFAQPGNTFFL